VLTQNPRANYKASMNQRRKQQTQQQRKEGSGIIYNSNKNSAGNKYTVINSLHCVMVDYAVKRIYGMAQQCLMVY
jgi:hypothetical protein